MTSQKSLKNNVNLNDFKRSLLGSILFPAIALIVLFVGMTMPVIFYVTSEEFMMTQVHNEVSVFLADNSMFAYSFSLIPIGMVICGMLTAVKSFYFMLSKKQVNVFFSLGVTRKTMFINRTLAGSITLFLAVLVPMAIIYITNIVSFGISAHLTKLFLYVVALFFTCGLAGFAIAAMATMISGNIFETVLTCLTPTVIPILIANLADGFCLNFLKGYVSISRDASWMSVLAPWGIATNLGADYASNNYNNVYDKLGPNDIMELLTRDTTPDKFVVPETYQVDLGLTLPVIIWFAVSVVLIVLGALLFKARKAEHANSFGHFAISRAINSAFVFVVVVYVLLMTFYQMVSPFVYFLIVFVAGAVAYFLVQLIMTRKLKNTLKSFAWYGVLAGVLAVALITVGTGFFGTYNKTPDMAEIKSVSAELAILEPYGHYINTYDNTEDFVESETDESKETILKAFDAVKNEKVRYGENALQSVTFVFRDKDNELIYREFDIYSAETYYNYVKALYSSDYFDAILEEYLLNDPPEVDESYMYEMGFDGEYIGYMDLANDSAGRLKNMSWFYSSNNMLFGMEYHPSEEYEQEMQVKAPFIKNSAELCEALYKDLSKMTFEQLFQNTSKPIGVLMVASSAVNPFEADSFLYPRDKWGEIIGEIEIEEEGQYTGAVLVGSNIPVYPEMTETVKYLKDNGYTVNELDLTVKEVLYTDSPLSINNAKLAYADQNAQKYRGWGSYTEYLIFNESEIRMFTQDNFSQYALDEVAFFIDEKVNNLDMLKRVYKDAGHPLISVTDTAKVEEIVGKSVSQYLRYKDNGRYVYVVYEEGPVVCYYLPEANVSVLK